MNKGSYILKIKLNKDKKINIGKLGNIFFKQGYYLYIGSSMNNLSKRIERHYSKNKKIHWHIDYFLKQAELIDHEEFHSNKKEECLISNRFNRLYSIKNFGSSDCKCKSHLYYSDKDLNIKIII